MNRALKKTVRFAKAGFFGFIDDDGKEKIAYLPEDVLEESVGQAIGIPVGFEHDEKTYYGNVSEILKGDEGWYNADILITDEGMKSILSTSNSGGFKTSNSYNVTEAEQGKLRKNGVNYDILVKAIDWLELTLTRIPKFQDAIILNSDWDTLGEQEPIEKEIETMIKINNKEYDESYVQEAIENFEAGSQSLLSKLGNIFIKNEDKIEEPVVEPAVVEPKEEPIEKAVEESVEVEEPVEAEEDTKPIAEVKNSDEIKADLLAEMKLEKKETFAFKDKH